MFYQRNSNPVLYNIKDLRKYFRSEESLGTPIEMYLESDSTFTSPLKGAIVDRSHGGCGLVLLTLKQLQINQICWIKFEENYLAKVRIVWLNKLEDNILRLGVQFVSPKLKKIIPKKE
jgi:c-di-GMP-binding flagellar brake protein YcgR